MGNRTLTRLLGIMIRRLYTLQLELLQVYAQSDQPTYSETKYQQNLSMRQKQDEEFLQWLSPSYWLVDSKLHGMRDKRKKGTLKWAHDMVQFQNWRLSQLSESSEASKERILWLRGPLGIGKSIMAGYFIDLLKCLYPNAIVAYFFCRFKESGLEKAHDIIRTLAYQCIENNPAGRYALESLKRKNFVISDSLGVAYLFEKLILDALRTCQKDVYIVIDGLDEADRTTVDKSDRLETPELHILLKCLLKLHSSRILIISRPIADISNVLQNVTVRDIGDENRQDIETYVRDYLDTNKSLRAQFKNVKVNPLNYFQEKANGVFLWVVLVVEQLAKTKSQSQFQKYLDGFSEASGSMEKLYSTILSKFSEEDKKWAAEIIKWLVATKGGISIKYLQDGVEWCLKDKLVDFHEFVQVDCGSILQKSESSVDPWTYPWTFERKTIYFVQLIHKTFREFVIDAERCPPMFYVDEKEANRQIALEGIRRLNSADLTFINYHWFNTWVDHLDKTATNDRSDEVLVALYQFFNSHGVRNWIKYGIQSTGPESVETPENRPLNTVLRWIRGCTISQQVEAAQGIEQNTEMGDRGSYMKWHLTILSDRSVLGDLVGKAAAIIWLHDQTANYRSVCNSFYIALKYYQRRKGSYLSNLEELNRLKSTDFSDIVVWAGSNETVLKRNLGVAYFTIYQWDDCIRCLNDPETLNDPDFRFRLGLAYLSKGDFDNALKSMQGSTHAYKNCPSLVETFGAVYIGSGKFDEAIAIIKPLLEATEYSFSPWILYTLVEIYYAKGEYASAIETLLAASEQDPDSVEIWWRIFELCKDSGNVAKFFEAALLTLRKHPNITSIWIVFWVANTELGDNDEAIQSLECSNEQPAELNIGLFHQYLVKGRFDQVFRLLFEAGTSLTTWRGFIHEAIWNKCKKTGKYDEAIGALKLVMENCLSESHDSYLLSWLLGDLYMAKGEYDNAIAVFDAAADENDSEINKAIFRAFVAKGDYDRAMKVFEPIVDTVVSYDQFWRSGLLEVYQKRNDFEGAIKTFERIIRNPNHSDDWSWAWSGLFEAYTKKGDQCGAIKRVDRAVKERGLLSPSWMEYDILDAYKAIDNVDAGIERLETILNDRPLDLWSRYALADAYRAKGDFNKALGLYQSSLELVPFDYMYLIQIGETHLAKSEYKAAIESYERAIDIHSRQRKMFSKPFPSILCAYLKMSRNSTDVFDWQIPIDNTFPQHFLWHSLGSAYEALSNSQAARDVYETALGCYKNVLKNDGSLLWEYSFHGFYSVRALDVFEWKQPMPKEALWSVLGELYKMRGDDAKALEAFQEAIVLKPENKWLNEMIDELKTRESIRQDT